MKKLFIALFALCLGCGFSASAQNWSKIGSGALKAAKALTLSTRCLRMPLPVLSTVPAPPTA